MNWDYSLTDRAIKQLKKLDKTVQKRIFSFLDERVAKSNDPRQFGKELKGDLKGLWRYRVGGYRIVCQIKDDKLLLLVVRVNHRKDVYR